MSGFEVNRLVAEIASAHHGDLNKLKTLTSAAEKAGFNAVKVQVYIADELLSKKKLKESKLLENELRSEEWRNYIQWFYAQFSESSYELIVEPFGRRAYEMVRRIREFSTLKLPTSDFADIDFAKLLAGGADHLYLGTGGSTREEVIKIVSELKKSHKCTKLSIIHGFQAYPTALSDSDLWKIKELRENLGVSVGYACHADASNQLTRNLPSCIAVGAGAEFIEKHINIDRSEKKSDYYSSLNLEELDSFVSEVNLAFSMNNVEDRGGSWLKANEQKYRETMKKYACMSENTTKGTLLEKKHICMKRVENGQLSYDKVELIIGKKLLRDMSKDQALTEADIQ